MINPDWIDHSTLLMDLVDYANGNKQRPDYICCYPGLRWAGVITAGLVLIATMLRCITIHQPIANW